jgi:hypothetical protein
MQHPLATFYELFGKESQLNSLVSTLVTYPINFPLCELFCGGFLMQFFDCKQV